MPRRVVAGVVCGALVVASTDAQAGPAQDLAQSKVVIGIERAVTFVTYETFTLTPQGGGTSVTESDTSLGLLSPDPSGVGDSFYLVPRLAFDFVVGSGFTLGGGAWIHTSVSRSQSSGGNSQDQPKPTYGGLAPRIGYILPMTDTLAFWPRAGIEYHSLSASSVGGGTGTTLSSGNTSFNQLAIDVEANLVIAPFEHFGLDLELFGAFPLTGTVSESQGSTTTNIDSAQLAVGLTAGLLGYF